MKSILVIKIDNCVTPLGSVDKQFLFVYNYWYATECRINLVQWELVQYSITCFKYGIYRIAGLLDSCLRLTLVYNLTIRNVTNRIHTTTKIWWNKKQSPPAGSSTRYLDSMFPPNKVCPLFMAVEHHWLGKHRVRLYYTENARSGQPW